MLRRSPRALLLWAAARDRRRRHRRVRRRHPRRRSATRTRPYGRSTPWWSRPATSRSVSAVRPGGPRRPACPRRAGGPGALDAPARPIGRVVAVPLLRGAVVTGRPPRRRSAATAATAPSRRAAGDAGGGRGRRAAAARATRSTCYATFDPQTVGDDVEPTLTVADAVPVVAVDRDDGPDAGGTGAAIGVTVLVTPTRPSDSPSPRAAAARSPSRRRHPSATPRP